MGLRLRNASPIARTASVALRDGTQVRIRPLRPADRDLYRRAVDSLSPRTMVLRFGGAKRHLTEREVDHFLDNGRDGREAFVATTVDGTTILAVGRFAPMPTDATVAEVALVVADDWQSRGLGGLMLARLVRCAGQRRYKRLYAQSDVDNKPIAVLLRRHRFHVTSASRGVFEWEAELAPDGRPTPVICDSDRSLSR